MDDYVFDSGLAGDLVAFIGAGQFLSILKSYRICWIAGGFGTYKTSLAFALARHFAEKEGYYIHSNTRNVWNDDLMDIDLDDDLEAKVIIVLDEGGTMVQHKAQIMKMAEYMRKLNMILVIPSFWPPTYFAQVVTVQRVIGLQQIGLPLVVYRWRVKLKAFEMVGHFAWLYPREVFGVYSSKDPGDTATKVVSWMLGLGKAYRKAFDYEEEGFEAGEVGSSKDGLPKVAAGGPVGEIEEFIERFDEAVDDASVLVGKGKRRRR